MSNVFDEMKDAIRQAADTLRAADNAASDMAWMLKGRLRQCTNRYTLAALKKELRDFDMVKGEWKS